MSRIALGLAAGPMAYWLRRAGYRDRVIEPEPVTLAPLAHEQEGNLTMLRYFTKLLSMLALVGSMAAPSQALVILGDPDVNVADEVTGTFDYRYTLTNNTTCALDCESTIGGHPILGYVIAVREFVVPYFDDALISAIIAPADWTWEIVNSDPFALGFGARALVWRATTEDAGITARGGVLGGFGYTSEFGPGKGPFSATLGNLTSMTGDPAIPLSPNAIAAGIKPSAVPEPGSWLLMLLGLVAIAATPGRPGWRRRWDQTAQLP